MKKNLKFIYFGCFVAIVSIFFKSVRNFILTNQIIDDYVKRHNKELYKEF